jgi:hypothetical protein
LDLRGGQILGLHVSVVHDENHFHGCRGPDHGMTESDREMGRGMGRELDSEMGREMGREMSRDVVGTSNCGALAIGECFRESRGFLRGVRDEQGHDAQVGGLVREDAAQFHDVQARALLVRVTTELPDPGVARAHVVVRGDVAHVLDHDVPPVPYY